MKLAELYGFSCVATTLCILAGCGCCRKIGAITSIGAVDVYEHGQIKRLDFVVVGYTAPLLGGSEIFLADSVPELADKRALCQLVNDSPPYRKKAAIWRAIDPVMSTYPWGQRMHWVLGTDPLVLGIGDPQGTLDPQDPDIRLFPFVRSDSEGEMVDRLLVFDVSPWRRRGWRSGRVPPESWRVVDLPGPMTTHAVIAQLDRYVGRQH